MNSNTIFLLAMLAIVAIVSVNFAQARKDMDCMETDDSDVCKKCCYGKGFYTYAAKLYRKHRSWYCMCQGDGFRMPAAYRGDQ